MPITDWNLQVIRANPNPTLGKVTITLDDYTKIYTQSYGKGIAWAVSVTAGVFSYYCLYADESPTADNIKLQLWKNVSGTFTLLDEWTHATASGFTVVDTISISSDDYSGVIQVTIDWDFVTVVDNEVVLYAQDSDLKTANNGVGLLTGDSTHGSTVTNSMVIANFIVQDEAPDNSKVRLSAKATVVAKNAGLLFCDKMTGGIDGDPIQATGAPDILGNAWVATYEWGNRTPDGTYVDELGYMTLATPTIT